MSSLTDAAAPGRRAVVDEAGAAALAAARAARVEVREVSAVGDLDAVVALFDRIWRRADAPPITTELLRALAQAGNYVVGAFDGADLVGACVGFFAAPGERSLHSHIAGVAEQVRPRHVGFALKLHQRAWALRHDVARIAWTFDPLVARNAYVNIAKLGATPTRYLPNFYGGMHDALNGADDSDRLLVQWDLTALLVARACGGRARPGDVRRERARGASVALGVSATGGPVPGPLTGPSVLVFVPPQIEAMRRSDPELAGQWRMAARDILGGLLAAGGQITGFDRTGAYVVRQAERN